MKSQKDEQNWWVYCFVSFTAVCITSEEETQWNDLSHAEWLGACRPSLKKVNEYS